MFFVIWVRIGLVGPTGISKPASSLCVRIERGKLVQILA